jgi:hypothetical protein
MLAGNASIGEGEAMAGNRKVLVKAAFVGALIGSVLATPLIGWFMAYQHGLPLHNPHGFLSLDLVSVLLPYALTGAAGGAAGGVLGAYDGKKQFAERWIGCCVYATLVGVSAAFLLFAASVWSEAEAQWCILC